MASRACFVQRRHSDNDDANFGHSVSPPPLAARVLWPLGSPGLLWGDLGAGGGALLACLVCSEACLPASFSCPWALFLGLPFLQPSLPTVPPPPARVGGRTSCWVVPEEGQPSSPRESGVSEGADEVASWQLSPQNSLARGLRASGSAGAGQAGCTGSPAPGNLVRVWEKGVWGPLSSVFLAAKGLA